MFNLDRDIIGNIIKISYNDSYSYDYIAFAIYESIKKNAGFHNRSFFIYICDEDIVYSGLDVNISFL